MKKLIFSVCAFLIVFASNAFGACTAEEFQKEVLAVQSTIVEMAKDPEKSATISTDMEKLFDAELMEFAQFAQSAAGDPAKVQQMLDKGCDLYSRMNKYLNEKK